MKYALSYMARYGRQIKYLDAVEIALTKCSTMNTMCNGCRMLMKCTKEYSRLCETREFKTELTSSELGKYDSKRQSGEVTLHVRLPQNNPLDFGI